MTTDGGKLNLYESPDPLDIACCQTVLALNDLKLYTRTWSNDSVALPRKSCKVKKHFFS
jgi:hypothetical protein